MAYEYAQTGPPFNFLGNLSETQKDAFSTWVTAQAATLPPVCTFHRIRAQQLRKTAGLLEKYYASGAAPDPLAPSFIKESWKPDDAGHFPYAFRYDHEPAMVVAEVKEHFRSKLVTMDDGVFHLNQVRVLIEKQEDLAQYASEGQAKVASLMDRLETLFGQPEYQATLVRDRTDQYQGEPRFRVHQLDQPTAWERATRSGVSPTEP